MLTEAKDHNLVETEPEDPATCTEPGKTAVMGCTNCSYTEGGDEIQASGEHSWNDGVITKAPTTSSEGTKTYKCTNCNEEKTEILQKLAIQLFNRSLLLEELVCVRYQFTFDSKYSESYIKANAGLLVWNEEDIFEGQKYISGTETYRLSSLTKNGSVYYVDANGVPAKMLGDAMYAVGYIVNSEGEYEYSELVDFNPVTYAKLALARSDFAAIHPLLVAMVNYGAAAQIQFGHKTDSLMNEWLTDQQHALVSYDPNYLEPLKTDTSKFKQSMDIELNAFSRSLVLENNVWMRFTVGFKNLVMSDVAEVKLLYWSENQYNSITECTISNVSGTSKLTPNGTYYTADIEGVPAKNMGNTYYACIYVKDTDGEEHYSEIKCFSIHFYASAVITTNGYPANLKELCKWMVTYSYEAKSYFG